jgi:multiple sugar transport system permease protein
MKVARDSRWSFTRSEAMWGYAMTLPLLAGITIFYYLATAGAIAISFTDWDILSPPEWVGLKNYEFLWNDRQFHQALSNTIRFAGMTTLGTAVVALGLALALNTQFRFRGAYRLLVFLPVLTMPIAVAYVWRWIFNPTYGVLHLTLGWFGIEGPNWLGNVNTALLSLVAVAVWMGVGFQMVIFLAGLQNIPNVYYEAAVIDGAGAWQRFRNVTLPLLTPTIFFNLVIGLIGSMQVFELIYALTQGGPLDSTRSIVYSLYDEGFRAFRMGRASAEGLVLFVLILVLTLGQFRLQRRWVHYE